MEPQRHPIVCLCALLAPTSFGYPLALSPQCRLKHLYPSHKFTNHNVRRLYLICFIIAHKVAPLLLAEFAM